MSLDHLHLNLRPRSENAPVSGGIRVRKTRLTPTKLLREKNAPAPRPNPEPTQYLTPMTPEAPKFDMYENRHVTSQSASAYQQTNYEEVRNVDRIMRCADSNNGLPRTFQSQTNACTPPVVAIPDDDESVNNRIMVSVDVRPTDSPVPLHETNSIYEMSTYFFNETDQSVVAVQRSGLTMTMPRMPTHQRSNSPAFVVRRVHRFRNATLMKSAIDHAYLLGKDSHTNSPELELILSKLNESFRTKSHYGTCDITATVDRIIPIDLLEHYRSFYVDDIDTLFRLNTDSVVIHHPLSPESRARARSTEYLRGKRLSGVNIEIIDNLRQLTSRFIHLAGTIVEVAPQRDPSREDGIYMTHFDNSRPNIYLRPVFSELAAAASLGLFPTREEALLGGDLRTKHLREIEELQVENQRLTRLNQNLAAEQRTEALRLEMSKNAEVHKYDRASREDEETARRRREEFDQAKHAREMAALRTEQEARDRKHRQEIEELQRQTIALSQKRDIEHERLIRNDYYEERSQVRRDSSEFMKWLPSIIAGLGVAATIFASTRSK